MRVSSNLVLLLALSGLTALSFHFSRQGGLGTYVNDASYLNQLDSLNTAIDREILILNAGLTTHFDRLSALSTSLVALTKSKHGTAPLNQVSDHVERKMTLVDDFKSDLAIYRNSVRAVRETLAHPDLRPVSAGSHDELDAVLWLLLEHMAAGEVNASHKLTRAMATLENSDAPQPDAVRTLLTHARLIVDVGRRKQATVRSISDHSFSSYLTRLHGESTETLNRTQSLAARWQISFVLSFLVLVGLTVQVVRSARHTAH
ncbi:MAG: DAHL domain-containing protein [Pseudomonadota bacterium]